jgi:hypothetical protein
MALTTFVRSILAIVAAYATLAIASTLVQETLLGGVSYINSPISILVLAGFLTPLCAVVSGGVAALVAGRLPYRHASVIALLVAMETAYLYTRHLVDGPFWFEASAGGALILGLYAGAYLAQKRVSHCKLEEELEEA